MGRRKRSVHQRNGESCCGDCSHFEPVSLRRREGSRHGARKMPEAVEDAALMPPSTLPTPLSATLPVTGWGVCELLVERLLSGGYPREVALPHNADAASCPDFEALEAAELRARLRRWGRVA